MANDCEYGLTSSIYTQNLDIAMRASREIKLVKLILIVKILRLCKVFMQALEKWHRRS